MIRHCSHKLVTSDSNIWSMYMSDWKSYPNMTWILGSCNEDMSDCNWYLISSPHYNLKSSGWWGWRSMLCIEKHSQVVHCHNWSRPLFWHAPCWICHKSLWLPTHRSKIWHQAWGLWRSRSTHPSTAQKQSTSVIQQLETHFTWLHWHVIISEFPFLFEWQKWQWRLDCWVFHHLGHTALEIDY